jgi:hypothetical protein
VKLDPDDDRDDVARFSAVHEASLDRQRAIFHVFRIEDPVDLDDEAAVREALDRLAEASGYRPPGQASAQQLLERDGALEVNVSRAEHARPPRPTSPRVVYRRGLTSWSSSAPAPVSVDAGSREGPADATVTSGSRSGTAVASSSWSLAVMR